MKLLQIYFDLILTIFFGLLIDKSLNRIKNLMGHKVLRIFIQFSLNIFIIWLFNQFYTLLNIQSITNDVLFVSVLLGVQHSLFMDIYTLY